MPADIIRYNEGRYPEDEVQVEQHAVGDPDMTSLWQRYLLSHKVLPVTDAPAATHPGLYRDSTGDTWLKAGDGSVYKLGAGEDGGQLSLGHLAPRGTPGPEGPQDRPVSQPHQSRFLRSRRSSRSSRGRGSGTHIQTVAIPDGSMVAKISLYNTVGWKQTNAEIKVGTPADRDRWYSGKLPQTEGQLAVVWPYEAVADNQELSVQVQTVRDDWPHRSHDPLDADDAQPHRYDDAGRIGGTMSKPLEEPPEVEEGDDSVNKPPETEIVTVVDFEDADDLEEEDVEDDEDDA